MTSLQAVKRVDLTLTITHSYGARGGVEPKLETKVIRARKGLSTTNVSFCIHNVTHCDLPWQIDWGRVLSMNEKVELYSSLFDRTELISLANRLLDNDLKKVDMEQYLNPASFPCVIWDITDRQEILEKYLDSNERDSSIMPMYVRPTLEPVVAAKMFEDLKISVDILAKTFSTAKNPLKGKFLIFKTGWINRFEPQADFRNLNNPLFEAWHAFLTYPYLDEESVRFLISEGVCGIGSDSIGLETPLFYVDPQSHNFQGYLRSISKIETQAPWGPVHLGFLAHKIFLLESLTNLEGVEMKANELVNGTLFLFPLPLGVEDAVLERVFFEPESHKL